MGSVCSGASRHTTLPHALAAWRMNKEPNEALALAELFGLLDQPDEGLAVLEKAAALGLGGERLEALHAKLEGQASAEDAEKEAPEGE
jgi:hypothetical protein